MQRRSLRAALPYLVLLAVGLGLSACGGDPNLMTFRDNATGPNEFLIVPAKPLQAPPQAGALPPPSPGVANRADATPLGDAVAALGGNPSRVTPTGTVPGGDAGLVNHASRLGRDPAIRSTLAAEDAEWRQRNNGRFLERVFNVNRYYDAYQRQSLDQYEELDRHRAAGRPTPAAPPEESLTQDLGPLTSR